jgi:hypothetical protein
MESSTSAAQLRLSAFIPFTEASRRLAPLIEGGLLDRADPTNNYASLNKASAEDKLGLLLARLLSAGALAALNKERRNATLVCLRIRP